MKPNLYYPVKPLHINQGFGANVTYYETNFGTNGHPGLDLMAAHGQPVYASHDGEAAYIKDVHGGEGIWNYASGFATIYWHLIGDTDSTYKLPIPFDSQKHPVKTGDLVGYADNTGAPYESSGDHLHFGLIYLDQYGTVLNQNNGFGGCVDPTPFLNGEFAIDKVITTVEVQAEQVAKDINTINPQSPSAPQEENILEEVVEGITNEIKQVI